MRPTSFYETVGDLEGEALVITMHHSLAEVEAEKGGHTLRNVETEALTNTLSDSLAEVKDENVGKTLKDVQNALPV